jgi:hypothetical protein
VYTGWNLFCTQRNLKAEDEDAGPNGLVEYRVVPGDGSDR